jgi:hypothetical protein
LRRALTSSSRTCPTGGVDRTTACCSAAASRADPHPAPPPADLGRDDDVCGRLMTIPGVGPMVALAYRATVDVPVRFRKSKSVGAVFGLTPSRDQSGESSSRLVRGISAGRSDCSCRSPRLGCAALAVSAARKANFHLDRHGASFGTRLLVTLRR